LVDDGLTVHVVYMKLIEFHEEAIADLPLHER